MGCGRNQRKFLILALIHPCGAWRVEQQPMPISPNLFPFLPLWNKRLNLQGKINQGLYPQNTGKNPTIARGKKKKETGIPSLHYLSKERITLMQMGERAFKILAKKWLKKKLF